MKEKKNMDSGKLHIEVVTPYELFFEGEADQIVLLATDGEIGILPGHSPVIIALSPGEIRIATKEKALFFAASDGYAKVELDNVVVVVGAAEWPEKIDLVRANLSLDRAQKRVSDPQTSPMEALHAKRSILRAKARIKVAGRLRKPADT